MRVGRAGHGSVTITSDRYRHLRPGNESEAAALLDALERSRRKKNLALARQVNERLVELRAETQPAL